MKTAWKLGFSQVLRFVRSGPHAFRRNDEMPRFDQSDLDRIGMKGIQRNRHKYQQEQQNFI